MTSAPTRPVDEPAARQDDDALLRQTVAAVRPLDASAMADARDRQDRLTKPRGALGALEDLSVRLAGLAGVCPPPLPAPAAVAVFAADHGVHAQGVTPWPQEVTSQMVANFLAAGAVVNAAAAQTGADVLVVDVGVAADLEPAPGLLARRVRAGTADMTQGPAMTRREALRAVTTGIEVARDLVAAGHRCLLTGDMGIANTTASAALVAAFTGADPQEATGRGTGIDDETFRRKVAVVRRALDRHRPDPADPVGVLAAVGGLEHAGLAGFVLQAAAMRVPVVLDGLIAGSAALVAQALAPAVVDACVAGHLSAEPGARLALGRLGLRPLLDLDMRLGEGSGALLALPLVQTAARILRDVATFDTAGVTEESASTDARTAAVPEAPRVPPPVARRVLVLGGARSGKSGLAERMLAEAAAVEYVATGPVPDDADPEWRERVRAHQRRRPTTWRTAETRELVPVLAGSGGPVLVDCLSTWLAGEMDECGVWAAGSGADDRLRARVDALVSAYRATGRHVVAVSNEVGSGVVPDTPSGRRFRDELGWLNQRLAAASDEAWYCVAGVPWRLR